MIANLASEDHKQQEIYGFVSSFGLALKQHICLPVAAVSTTTWFTFCKMSLHQPVVHCNQLSFFAITSTELGI